MLAWRTRRIVVHRRCRDYIVVRLCLRLELSGARHERKGQDGGMVDICEGLALLLWRAFWRGQLTHRPAADPVISGQLLFMLFCQREGGKLCCIIPASEARPLAKLCFYCLVIIPKIYDRSGSNLYLRVIASMLRKGLGTDNPSWSNYSDLLTKHNQLTTIIIITTTARYRMRRLCIFPVVRTTRRTRTSSTRVWACYIPRT